MKLRLLILALASSLTLCAADSVPIFNATLTAGKESRFVLVSIAGDSSSWLRLGDTFQGYTLKAFNAKEAALDLERDGKITRVTLVTDAAVANAPLAPTRATLADAEEVFRVMCFEEMMGKMLDQQKKTMGPMMQQQMARAAAQMNLSAEDKEAFMAFQKKAFDDVMGAIMGPEMKTDMAKAYSEVFSKEELAGLSAFYSTPTGQALIDKTPEVSGKMQALLMPRMMKSMETMQKSVGEFVTQMKAKNEAAGAAQGAAPAPAAPPAPAPKP
jgi:hypothetical protein